MDFPHDPAQNPEQALLEAVQQGSGQLTRSILKDERTRHLSTAYLPDHEAVIEIVQKLIWLLYPGFFGPRKLSEAWVHEHVHTVLADVSRALFDQVSGAFRYERNIESRSSMFEEHCFECDALAARVMQQFIGSLPEVRRKLSLDVQAAYDGDPAARHVDETIFCYPGVRALSIHRLAHELYRQNVPLIPRIMGEFAHSETGIDIHPGASIGTSFFIDHGTGVVIGETTVIGEHCKVYQGVTLGAKSFPKDERGHLMRDVKRHPTLEDYVTVYAGATILGGDTVIGAGSVVNGGVFLTNSIPPGHVVRGPKAEVTLRSNPELPPSSYTI